MNKRDGVFAGVGFLAGVVAALLGVLLWKTDVDYTAELTLSDLVAAVVALSIALGIGYILQERNHLLQSKSDLERAERERLIARTEGVVASASNVRDAEVRQARGTGELGAVLAELRRFSNDLAALESRYEMYGVRGALAGRIQSVTQAFANYRILIGESTHVAEPPTQAERDQNYNALTDELDAMVRDLSRLEWPS